MDKGIYVALSGAVAQEKRMNMISNNLANANSTAFKSDGILFETFLNNSGKGMEVEPRVNNPVFVKAESGYSDYSQGPLIETGNDLDIAIDGEGFFLVESGKERMVTRNGNFKIAGDGSLVTAEGKKVLGSSGGGGYAPIVLKKGVDLNVSTSGELFTFKKGEDGEVERKLIGKLALVNYRGVNDLKKVEGSLFKMPSAEGGRVVPSKATLKQGFLERSNVNIIQEMANLITVTRSVETYQKMIRAYDEMKGTLITQVGS